jgi:methylenetetrahydrofolate reductase (NADPH)
LKTFRGALSSNAFAVTAELSWAGQSSPDETVRRAAALAEHVDGIQLADNPLALAQTSPTALAALLLREGIDATPTLNCRDRNRIALQSELLGLRAIGVTSLVLNQGSGIPQDQDFPAKEVFDASCNELITMAQEIDESAILLGTGADVPATEANWNEAPLLERSSAGARFLRLLPCSDIELLRHHMARMVESRITWHYSVIVSLEPLPAKDCTPLIRDVLRIPGVSGINLVCRDDTEALIELIKESGVRPDP